jgi:hypothetical protein
MAIRFIKSPFSDYGKVYEQRAEQFFSSGGGQQTSSTTIKLSMYCLGIMTFHEKNSFPSFLRASTISGFNPIDKHYSVVGVWELCMKRRSTSWLPCFTGGTVIVLFSLFSLSCHYLGPPQKIT